MFTDFLKLFKFNRSEEDPKATAFNIDRFLNDNWDKLDTWLKSFSQAVVKSVCGVKPNSNGDVQVPNATTRTAGIVMLSSGYESDSESTAATNRAVNIVRSAALTVSTAEVMLSGLTYKSTLQRAGKTVRFSNAADCSSLRAGGWTVLGSIPFGYKPLSEVRVSVATFDPSQQVQLSVSADGDVRVYNYGAAITSLRTFVFDVCWITEGA